ncbi:hypothetical protein NSA53_04955 [Cellulosimicrobium cellulans]|jgi:hypothetical protein|uniref:hypothetical protein n=1 Tax=Cellulosimicrobium cellulans TaxID=1710 RepID=UPI000890C981|nr:hypothetical protein [Sphaerisporangium cinnabarinum]MCR1981588.1 hypothetical protein [Cellulosimicrobium cellulans]SDG19406.1 hypothetical protein SAMN04487781_3982 [Cellulosimicrobium cellulans]
MQGWSRGNQAVRAAARGALGRLTGQDRERGDVPGWVLITLMTAGLVIALWAVAGPALTEAFSNAISSVGAP